MKDKIKGKFVTPLFFRHRTRFDVIFISDDEKSSNLVPKVDEEEFHYEVMKKPMIGAGGDVGQIKDKIKGNS